MLKCAKAAGSWFITSGLARMNMILHHNPGAVIEQGNTLADPKFLDGEQLKTFDYVVANPPFSDSFGLESRFNLFEAINMTRQEIRHSRFLAFLLDPAALHGLGDRFLRAMLVAVVSDHPNAPISRLDATIAELTGASVHCERDHFDVTVHLPSLQLLFVIENKIGATESTEQLSTYRSRAISRYPELRFLGCFLTPDGYDGEDPEWGTMSYATVASELGRLLLDGVVPNDVSVAIRHYVHLIERRIVASQALIDACRTIYQQHREALDLVMEHGQESLMTVAFKQFQSGHPGLQATTTRTNTVFFCYESWLRIADYPHADRKRWSSPFPVLMWFEQGVKKLYLRVEVGPIVVDPGARPSIITGLRTEWRLPSGKQLGKGKGAVYTRIKTVLTSISNDPDVDELVAAMEKLWVQYESINVEQTVRKVVEAASV